MVLVLTSWGSRGCETHWSNRSGKYLCFTCCKCGRNQLEAPGEWQQLTAPLLLPTWGTQRAAGGSQVACWISCAHNRWTESFRAMPPPTPRLKVIGGNDRLARAGGGILEGCIFSLCLKMIQAYSWHWHSACTSLKMGWTRDVTLVFKNKLLDGERRAHRVAWRLTGPPGHWGQ